MNEVVLSKGKLLDDFGCLAESGYATSLVKEYNRRDIKAGKMSIKEWDYYLVSNGLYGLALTVADNGYMSLVSASVIDYRDAKYKTTSEMKFFSLGKINLPPTSESGDIIYASKRVIMKFLNDGKSRRLLAEFKKFQGEDTLKCDIVLTETPKDSMVIATPFKAKKKFYYNQKINCMTAEGSFSVGKKEYKFVKGNSLATLDWGRGVWTYSNTWYWSSLSTYINGRKLGFNFGYGFGDNSAATENMLFIDGRASKIKNVKFNIPEKNGKEDFLSLWTVSDNEGRVSLTFRPILDRYDNTNALVLSSNQHQVFGYFSGDLVFDNGEKIKIFNEIGFAEKVKNRW